MNSAERTERFVVVWCEFVSKGKTLTQFARRMRTTNESASARASFLRKQGLRDLPCFPKGKTAQPLNIKRLQRLVKKHSRPILV